MTSPHSDGEHSSEWPRFTLDQPCHSVWRDGLPRGGSASPSYSWLHSLLGRGDLGQGSQVEQEQGNCPQLPWPKRDTRHSVHALWVAAGDVIPAGQEGLRKVALAGSHIPALNPHHGASPRFGWTLDIAGLPPRVGGDDHSGP